MKWLDNLKSKLNLIYMKIMVPQKETFQIVSYSSFEPGNTMKTVNGVECYVLNKKIDFQSNGKHKFRIYRYTVTLR